MTANSGIHSPYNFKYEARLVKPYEVFSERDTVSSCFPYRAESAFDGYSKGCNEERNFSLLLSRSIAAPVVQVALRQETSEERYIPEATFFKPTGPWALVGHRLAASCRIIYGLHSRFVANGDMPMLSTVPFLAIASRS